MQNPSKNANGNSTECAAISAPVDLNAPGIASAVSKRVKVDIDHYCETAYDDGHRNHLGASLIGHNCKRYLWYVFRWCRKEPFTGRMQRLFNRGHREEERFVEWLRGIGCEVWEVNPENGKQFRISSVMGHFGGSLDGIVKLPPRFNVDKPVLAEFKTSGTGAAFNKVVESGMMVAKPQHYAQTSMYGWKYGFEYVLYHIINKNDDDLHVELVKLNWKLGEQLELKAEQIIKSQVAPPRYSDNPTKFECTYCPMKGICHNGEAPERNCRSCVNATPVEGAQWFCSAHNGIIPPDFIKVGCEGWKAITE